MKTINLLLIALSVCMCTTKVFASEETFFESDADFRRMHRNLLQLDDEDEPEESNKDETVKEQPEEETQPPKGIIPLDGSDLLGPDLFYTEDFLLSVKGGIDISWRQNSEDKPIITTVNKEALSIEGSFISKEGEGGVYMVTIDWKGKELENGVKIGSLTMKFNKTRTEFTLVQMELPRLSLNNKLNSFDLKVKSRYGYKVSAPIGTAFACNYPGIFNVFDEQAEDVGLVGITFPEMKLQLFFEQLNMRNFGPLWYCGELMPIGLWVGLIVTLFFALICYYGFSMLASIHTMDRFDDPKGKQIHVPQTE